MFIWFEIDQIKFIGPDIVLYRISPSLCIDMSGGAVCGGVADTSETLAFSMSGGAVCGGAADVTNSDMISLSYDMSGGAVCGGDADVSTVKKILGFKTSQVSIGDTELFFLHACFGTASINIRTNSFGNQSQKPMLSALCFASTQKEEIINTISLGLQQIQSLQQTISEDGIKSIQNVLVDIVEKDTASGVQKILNSMEELQVKYHV